MAKPRVCDSRQKRSGNKAKNTARPPKMDFERHSYTEVVHILLNELNNMRYEYAVSKVPGCSQGRAVVAVLPQSGRFEETRGPTFVRCLLFFGHSLYFSCPPLKVAKKSNTTASQTWNVDQNMTCPRQPFQSSSSANEDEVPPSDRRKPGFMSKEWKDEAMSQQLFAKCEPTRLKSKPKQSPVLLRKLNSLDLGEAKQT